MLKASFLLLGCWLLAAAFPQQASATEQGAPPCEIHLSGGANTDSSFVRQHFDMDAPLEDAALRIYEESGQRAYLSPVVRAVRLDDHLLNRLVPQGMDAKIIRHGGLQNQKEFKRSKQRFFGSNSKCHGELMVYNVYGVFFPAEGPNDFAGVLTPILAGRNRIHMTFEFHFYDGLKAKRVRIKESVDMPLNIAGIDNRLPRGPETVAELIRATNNALEEFLARHEKKLPSY